MLPFKSGNLILLESVYMYIAFVLVIVDYLLETLKRKSSAFLIVKEYIVVFITVVYVNVDWMFRLVNQSVTFQYCQNDWFVHSLVWAGTKSWLRKSSSVY